MTAGRDVVVEKTCAECGEPFGITAEERDHLERKGWNMPSRCRPCRQASRYRQQGVTFTDTACSRCSRRAVVPFRPTQARDLLCHECHEADRTALRGGR